MKRLLIVLLVLAALPATAAAAPPDLGIPPYKECGGIPPHTPGSGCPGTPPLGMHDTQVAEVTYSPHVVKVGGQITFTMAWQGDWPVNSFPVVGTPVTSCPPVANNAGFWSCTMTMNAATNAYVRTAVGFSGAVDEDYYAVIGEGRAISGKVTEPSPASGQIRPAAGVTVAATVNGKVFRAVTSKFGEYNLVTDDAAGTVSTSGRHCLKSGLPAQCKTKVDVGSGDQSGVDFERPALVKIKGRVADGCPCESDKGIEGVTIRAEDPATGDVLDAATTANTDDTEGAYELMVRAGQVKLTTDDEDVCAFVPGVDCEPERTLDVQDETLQDWEKQAGCDDPDAAERRALRAEGDGEECPLVVNTTGDEEDKDADDKACDVDTTTTKDDCTLRAALQVAKARTSPQTITFNIRGAGAVPKIKPKSALPEITNTVTIDGTSQAGAPAGEPGVEVDGSEAGASTDGLIVKASNTAIKGLAITSFGGDGVGFMGGEGSSLKSSWLGVRRGGSGFEAAENGTGAEIQAARTTVEANVFAGSGDTGKIQQAVAFFSANRNASAADVHAAIKAIGIGVFVSSSGATGARIAGNVIGLAPDGTRIGSVNDKAGQFGNVFGVAVAPFGGGARITGVTVTENTISGNMVGLLSAASGISVTKNKVGPGPDGKPVGPAPFSNGTGILVAGLDTEMTVEQNIVQGNVMGVIAGGRGATIRGNTIGVDQSLAAFGEDFKRAIGSQQPPNIGLHNVVGMVVAGVQVTVANNSIVGNLMGLTALGSQNAITGNTIGGSFIAPKPISQLRARDMSSVIGVLLAGNGQRFTNNDVSGTIFGTMSFLSRGSQIERNRYSTNIISLLSFNTIDSNFNANQITGSGIGIITVQHEFTAAELAAFQVNDAGEAEREAIVNAPMAQSELSMAGGQAGDPITAADVSPSAASARAVPRQATGQGSVENDFIGNSIGTGSGGAVGTLAPGAEGATSTDARAGNAFGVWLLGGQRNVRFEENRIAGNKVAGLLLGPGVRGDWPTNVRLARNRIYDNHAPGVPLRGLGVDLLELSATSRIGEDLFGPSPPDPGDVDDGANSLQNAPELSGAAPEGRNATRVVGTLNSAASTSYTLEFFANGRCGPFGYGEGEEPVGNVRVRTDADGNAAFSGRMRLPANRTRGITAMATGPNGTSEFSNCQRVADEGLAAAAGPLMPDRRGNVEVTVFCLDDEPCSGRTTIEQLGNSGNARAAQRRARVTRLGRKAFRVRRGRRSSVRVRLPAAVRRRLTGTRTIRVRATVALSDGRKDVVTWTLHARRRR